MRNGYKENIRWVRTLNYPVNPKINLEEPKVKVYKTFRRLTMQDPQRTTEEPPFKILYQDC